MNGLQKKSSRRYLLYLGLLLLALTAMFSLRTCSSDTPFRRSEPRPSGGDTIDVAIEYSPLSYYRYADTIGGLNYDLLRTIADSSDLVFKYYPVANFNSSLSGLEQGRYDLVVADIPLTLWNEDSCLFTVPVFLDRQVLIQRLDSAGNKVVDNRLQLAGRCVHVGHGSTASMRLRNLSDEIGDSIIVVEDSVYGSEQMFLLIAGGEIEFAVVNENLAKAMACKFSNVDVTTEISFTQFQSWAMRKDNTALKERLDSVIMRVKRTLVYDDLCRRYGVLKAPDIAEPTK